MKTSSPVTAATFRQILREELPSAIGSELPAVLRAELAKILQVELAKILRAELAKILPVEFAKNNAILKQEMKAELRAVWQQDIKEALDHSLTELRESLEEFIIEQDAIISRELAEWRTAFSETIRSYIDDHDHRHELEQAAFIGHSHATQAA